MTNFEILAEIVVPLNSGETGILAHFLSFMGISTFVKDVGPEDLQGSAQVSSVLDCSTFIEQGSLFFAIACSVSNSELL